MSIKYLGIDWGEKRIGLSIGESETKLAVPFKTVGGIKELLEVIQAEEISELVIGEPLKLNHKALLDARYKTFINELGKSFHKPIHFIDERLSSRAADALPGGAKTKAGRDEIAAMIILQSYLDQME